MPVSTARAFLVYRLRNISLVRETWGSAGSKRSIYGWAKNKTPKTVSTWVFFLPAKNNVFWGLFFRKTRNSFLMLLYLPVLMLLEVWKVRRCVFPIVLLLLLIVGIRKQDSSLHSTPVSNNVQRHNIYFAPQSRHAELHFSQSLLAAEETFPLLRWMHQLPKRSQYKCKIFCVIS